MVSGRSIITKKQIMGQGPEYNGTNGTNGTQQKKYYDGPDDNGGRIGGGHCGGGTIFNNKLGTGGIIIQTTIYSGAIGVIPTK
jgi:hypothetical protein